MGIMSSNKFLWWSDTDYTEHAFVQSTKPKNVCQKSVQQLTLTNIWHLKNGNKEYRNVEKYLSYYTHSQTSNLTVQIRKM